MHQADQLLQGLRVLVTRPQHQAKEFISLLEDAGAETFSLPTIEIAFEQRDSLTDSQTGTARHSDYWIFTSVNAVIGALRCNLISGNGASLKNDKTTIAAIGQATKKYLNDQSIPVDFAPYVNSSTEQFLELFGDNFKKGDNVTIIRGDDGRDELKYLLESRGCHVSYLCVYRRQLPDITFISARETLKTALPCAISITSDKGLNNLLKLLPVDIHSALFNCALIINSERCAALARQYGFRSQLVVASPPGNIGQINALASLLM